VFVIAVPTPFIHNNRCNDQNHIPEPDLTYVEAAAKSIAQVLKKGDLIILESTSPVGTTDNVAELMSRARPDLTFPQQKGEASNINIAYCPERVLPGKIVHELVKNDRIIGGMTQNCSKRAISFYKTFVEGECIQTDARTAEMCKLTENSFRDVNIAFANELSMICDELNVNVWELIQLSNLHPRVNILQPGPGVGGHCIAVDPWFIVSKTPELANIIHSARKINDGKPSWVIDKVRLAVGEYLQKYPDKTTKDITIACYGMAFKPDIDDLRESPALEIIQQISKVHPGPVIVVEPNISDKPNGLSNRIELKTQEMALEISQIGVILVAHKAFKETERTAWCSNAVVIDTCGIIN
jgi:UDP-N-acetyl-D-mannosaminuronic acid dehydrogenase